MPNTKSLPILAIITIVAKIAKISKKKLKVGLRNVTQFQLFMQKLEATPTRAHYNYSTHISDE